jgi:hypothetical protein
MSTPTDVLIVIAHYGIGRKVTKDECLSALGETGSGEVLFVDFEACQADLKDLYDLPFENLALAQQRLFAEKVEPLLKQHPSSHIAYFGLIPIPLGFHFGYLVGNMHGYTVFQWHHQKNKWLSKTDPPVAGYNFELLPYVLPQEIQKGKGEVVVRIGTSFKVDVSATREIISDPANEFNLELREPHPDALYSQEKITEVVNAFQDVLNAYASKLTDRDQIHLFMAIPAGLPFALGTRINPNIYPFVQTYQYGREYSPKYKDAILIAKEVNDLAILSEEDRIMAQKIRAEWESLLQDKLKPFIRNIVNVKPEVWARTICVSEEEYNQINELIKSPWSEVIHIGKSNLKTDHIDLSARDVEGGFQYIEKTNRWQLDDGFLVGLKKRLDGKAETDLMQAARLFLFHESLHYANDGHRLTKETADGIGQFPKVIEEADYQADVWGLLTDFRYCELYEAAKFRVGVKEFFCNAIDTAAETMWSFAGNGLDLDIIQIRSMNRFLNWYWQWIRIENLSGTGTLAEAVKILLDKPVIEFAGAPMTLRAHRTFYRLKGVNLSQLQLAAFLKNRVHRFSPSMIGSIVDGFRQLNGEKIKQGLKSFHNTVG